MKQNNTLSLHRIRLLMQWDWALNRKKYIWEWMATFMAYFTINWFLLLTAGRTHDLDGFQAVALFSVFLLFAIFAARGLAAPVSHNETRLTFLTLPASNGEKFLYRALFVTVFYFVISAVLFVMADVAQYVCRLMLEWGMPYLQFSTSPTLVTSHLPMVFTESFYGMLPLTMGLSLLLIHATAVLAGFLNKWAFAVILLIVLRRSFFALNWMEKATGGEVLLANMVLICLIVFCWWLAYRLFCRRQIV